MQRLLKSFSYALVGICLALKEGDNFKIQLVCAALAIGLGVGLRISLVHFALVLLVIACVLSAEVFNTALEELCDKFQPTHDRHIAKIKDLGAGAALIMSVGAVFVGIMIFGPYLLLL